VIALLLSAALAGGGDPELEEVLDEALATYPESLHLDDAPPMYHLRYHVLRYDSVAVRASMGSLVYVDPRRTNRLGVEVRLGTPQFDNLGFGGWQDGLSQAPLPVQLSPHALSVGLWRLTDTAYKEAVEQYARKEAQVPDRPDHPGDYTLTGPVQAAFDAPQAAEPEPLADLAQQLSEAWLGATRFDRADVYVGHEVGRRWTVDTEGTDVRTAHQETTVRAAAHLRTDDGALLTEQVLWTVTSPSELPDEAAMQAQVEAARDRLEAAGAATPLADEYVGPMLFEHTAATELFQYLLPEQLEGTPAEIPFDTWLGDLGAARDPVRVGRRVLPPGWEVVDDPLGDPSHPGSYTHDAEGTPAERIELVTDGIVRTLAMSRVPRSGLEQTNGHARGAPGQRPEARVTMLSVTPPRQVSPTRLRKLALKAARAYGRDWVFVVRRLQVPAVQNLSRGGGFVLFGEEEQVLPSPVVLVKLHADGTEELVRGARFASVNRFLLRDLLAAGPTTTADAMFPVRGEWGDLGATQGLPGQVTAPSVLVGEVELVPSRGDPRDAPRLPPPPLGP